MLGDLAFFAFWLVGIPCFLLYAVLVWEGRLWRSELLARSCREDFWDPRGLAGLTIGAIWPALFFAMLLMAWLVAKFEVVPRDLHRAIFAAIMSLGIGLVLVWIALLSLGWPRWALPPWLRAAQARTARRPKHVVTVHYVSDAAHGTDPYFVALCSCDWVGLPVSVGVTLEDARRRSFDDARSHSQNVRMRIRARLDPIPDRAE